MLKGGVIMDVVTPEQAIIAEICGRLCCNGIGTHSQLTCASLANEVLTPADWTHHIEKHNFKVPFVCGAKDLGEALRRINEGAAMIRTKGEAGTGDVSEAVKHIPRLRRRSSSIKRI
ncbi:ADQ_G0006560.mRNA.1.CDS.1 [Saccharomyces cerevisiae]|nr:ADQ_G0006560.mRNA.1.CDS.1 [Saccharomyces cerevisiae]CAI6526586.1 ADQ_G0006560.mRNA.1.CDS.1 [Saccharomyces cerevisiae]